jgi:hypothetical protein
MSMAIHELSYIKYQDIIRVPVKFTLSGGNVDFIEDNMHFTIFLKYKIYHFTDITTNTRIFVEYKRKKIMNLIIKQEHFKDIVLQCTSDNCIRTKFNAVIGVYK